MADGAVDVNDTGLLRAHVCQGGGVVMSGPVPFVLAGEDQYLGQIADWFGARFLLLTWGADISMANSSATDMAIGPETRLPGLPSWRSGEWAVLPVGLNPRTDVVGWYGNDIAAFCIAVQPDSVHLGRVFYQARLGDTSNRQLDSLYASGIRWAARTRPQ